MISLPLHEMDHEMQQMAFYASMDMPTILDPRFDFEGYALADGGTYGAVNMQDAINSCRKLDFDDKNIFLDLSVCGGVVSDHQQVRTLER